MHCFLSFLPFFLQSYPNHKQCLVFVLKLFLYGKTTITSCALLLVAIFRHFLFIYEMVLRLFSVSLKWAKGINLYTYIHILYISLIQKFVKVTVGCGISHKNTQYKQLVMLPLSMPSRHLGIVEVWLHLFLTLTRDGGENSASCPGCFAPGEESQIPI
jgi:hypothetical protein